MVKRAKGPGQVDTRERVAEMIGALRVVERAVSATTAIGDTEADVLDAVGECLDGAIRGLKRFLAHRQEWLEG